MKLYILALSLLVIASILYVWIIPCKEGFQDTTITETVGTPVEETPIATQELPDFIDPVQQDPVVQAAVTNAANVKESTLFTDIRTSSQAVLDSLDRAGGPDVVKKRLTPSEADTFDTALNAVKSTIAMLPAEINETTIAEMRAKGIDIIQFEPLFRGQIDVLQKALVKPISQELAMTMAPAPAAGMVTSPGPIVLPVVEPSQEAEVTNEIADAIVSDTAGLSVMAGTTMKEGFSSFKNPYNKPNGLQSYEFKLGKQALIDSVQSPLFHLKLF